MKNNIVVGQEYSYDKDSSVVLKITSVDPLLEYLTFICIAGNPKKGIHYWKAGTCCTWPNRTLESAFSQISPIKPDRPLLLLLSYYGGA